MSSVKKSARIGAAAFALGLSLAGPQAVGVASADRGEGDSSGSVSAGSVRAEAAPRGVGRESRVGRAAGMTEPVAADVGDAGARRGVVAGLRGGAGRTAEVGEPAVAVPPESTTTTTTTAAAAAVDAGAEAPAAASSDTMPAAAPGVAERAVKVPAPAAASSDTTPAATPGVVQVPAAAMSTPRAAVVSGGASEVGGDALTAATPGPEDWAQAAADTAAQFEYDVQSVVADPFGSIQAGLDTGVNTVFDTLGQWLSGLPANPISDYLAGALLLVRRGLFDQVATTDPFTDILRANGQWEGSLNVVDPMDEVLTYTVTDAPDHGSIQINPDGTYTYTPDEGYTGTDTIIIEVHDPGFNLFNPLATRTQSVTVTVGSTDFLYPSIKNLGCLLSSGICFGAGKIKVAKTIYRIGLMGFEREVLGGPELGSGDTFFIQYADAKTGAPAPGKFFFYRTTLLAGDDDRERPLIMVEFTQAEGRSKVTVVDTKLQYWGGGGLNFSTGEDWYWTRRILGIKGPNNATEQFQLAIPPWADD